MAEFVNRFGGRSFVDIRKGLFDKQLALLQDESRRKLACCSRRAGKTHVAGRLLVDRAHRNPGQKCMYLAITKGHARRLCWPVLHELNVRFGLGIAFNETTLTASFPNGSVVWLSGADNIREVEKYRGEKFCAVIVDEAASFGEEIGYLVNDVLYMALADLDGELILMGTPSASCSGLFFEEFTSDRSSWSKHHWTVVDNPEFPRWSGKPNWRELAARFVDDTRMMHGWDHNNATYQREMLGRWVRDTNSLVYPFNDSLNLYGQRPHASQWTTIIGVDLGFDDATAFEVVAFSGEHPALYEVDHYRRSGMNVTEIANKARELCDRWSPISVQMDTGGLGKTIAEEIRQRHAIPVEAAEKTKKNDYIELLGDDLRTGRVKVLKGSPLAEEMRILQWSDDKRVKEHPAFSNHSCDAFLYAWRCATHYTHTAQEPITVDEWVEREDARQYEQEQAREGFLY